MISPRPNTTVGFGDRPRETRPTLGHTGNRPFLWSLATGPYLRITHTVKTGVRFHPFRPVPSTDPASLALASFFSVNGSDGEKIHVGPLTSTFISSLFSQPRKAGPCRPESENKENPKFPFRPRAGIRFFGFLPCAAAKSGNLERCPGLKKKNGGRHGENLIPRRGRALVLFDPVHIPRLPVFPLVNKFSKKNKKNSKLIKGSCGF